MLRSTVRDKISSNPVSGPQLEVDVGKSNLLIEIYRPWTRNETGGGPALRLVQEVDSSRALTDPFKPLYFNDPFTRVTDPSSLLIPGTLLCLVRLHRLSESEIVNFHNLSVNGGYQAIPRSSLPFFHEHFMANGQKNTRYCSNIDRSRHSKTGSCEGHI